MSDDLHETAVAYSRFFGLSEDAAALAAAGSGVPLEEARERCLPSEERERLRVQRINDHINECRRRSGGRW
jgi:hypothetical protein